MHSIKAMEIEMGYQIEELPRVRLPKQAKLDDSIIIGSGDSYVIALVVQHASNYRAISCNPMDILLHPQIAKNRKTYIVSVSGKTMSNIIAAKVAKEHYGKTIAITSRPDSELAKTCDEVIHVKYKNVGIPTSGTISFTAHLISSLALVKPLRGLGNLNKIFQQSIYEAETQSPSGPEKPTSYIFLGNGIFFPLAMYGALKVNEVLGIKSFAYSLHEFCHAPIFSIKKDDKIIIVGSNEYDNKNSLSLNHRLKEMGFSSVYADCTGPSLEEKVLKSIFFLQLYVYKESQKQKIEDCYFLKNETLLALSSDLIYFKVD